MCFEGRAGLITGAASGIGRATALKLASEGAFVAVADRDGEAGKETVELIGMAGGRARFHPCDVAESGAVESVVWSLLSEYGRLDFAHNNAAIAPVGYTVDSLPEGVWHDVLAVNLTGVWMAMKAELTAMRAQGSGATSTRLLSAPSRSRQRPPLTTPRSTRSSASRRKPRWSSPTWAFG